MISTEKKKKKSNYCTRTYSRVRETLEVQDEHLRKRPHLDGLHRLIIMTIQQREYNTNTEGSIDSEGRGGGRGRVNNSVTEVTLAKKWKVMIPFDRIRKRRKVTKTYSEFPPRPPPKKQKNCILKVHEIIEKK